MNTERLSRVLNKLSARGIPQMIITDPVSIFYLTGYSLDPGERLYALYIHADGTAKLFINMLFAAPENCGAEIVRFTDTDDYISLLRDAVELSAPLGIDKVMPARFLLPLMQLCGETRFELSSICVDTVRACKDTRERELMRKASRINDLAMAEFKGLLREGVTEKEVAASLLEIYRKHGGEELSFSPIVSFGANSAIGHHEPDDTPLREGDVVILDVGCTKSGYCADMTRAFFFRKIAEPKHRDIYETVLRAVKAAEALCAPGVPLCEIDGAARKVIADAGYGEYFNRRTGHFIGMEVHEYGDVSSANTSLTEPGNVFSIEPGINIDGEFGLYIEDLVLITEGGCEILNSYTKDLQIIE